MKTACPPTKKIRRKRKGLVLLSVLLVSLFLLAASTGFALFARRTVRTFSDRQRTFTAGMICETLLPAAKLLIASHPGKAHSFRDEAFAPRTVTFEDEGATAEMAIIPLDDRLPATGLFLPDGKTLRAEMAGPWRRLWQRAGAEQLAEVALDFLDSDSEPRLGGGEREWYLNRPLLSLDELLLVPGMTKEILYGSGASPGAAGSLTLWSDGKINANTAEAPALALLDGLDERIAADIVRVRESKIFESMADLSAVPSFPPGARSRLMNVLSFTSSHFKVRFSVEFADGQKMPAEVILERKGSVFKTVRWEGL